MSTDRRLAERRENTSDPHESAKETQRQTRPRWPANLLRNQLGYPVEIIALDEQAQWDALAAGDADASLEVWPSGHGERIAQYIDEQKVVENGGELGVVNQIA